MRLNEFLRRLSAVMPKEIPAQPPDIVIRTMDHDHVEQIEIVIDEDMICYHDGKIVIDV